MTESEAKQLREAWKKLGNPPCDHPALLLQQSEHGFLTGRYVCTKCGAVIKGID